MGGSKREQLLALLDRVDQSPAAQAEFLESPIAMINRALELGLDEHIAKTPVANKLLIAALRDENTTTRLQKTTSEYQAGEIDIQTARSAMTETLIEAIDFDEKEWWKELLNSLRSPIDPALIDQELPPPEKFDPQAIAIANVAAAVDIVVVVTEAAVFNSELVFTGRGRNDIVDIRRLARTLGRGE